MVAPGKADKSKQSKPTVYHEHELDRGWRLLHQHLALDVDLPARSFQATATFTLRALNLNCSKIAVNLRRCHVLACEVNHVPVEWFHHSPLDDDLLYEQVSSDLIPHRNEDVKRESESGRVFENNGELVLTVPAHVSDSISDGLLAAAKQADAAENMDGVSDLRDVQLPYRPAAPLHKLPAVTVTIKYEVRNPIVGAVFYGTSSEAYDMLRDPLYLLTESRYGLVRCWTPCIDSLRWCDRCFFDLDVTVDSKQTVVASGDLVQRKLLRPDTPHERMLYLYRSTVPMHACEFALAVGPFSPFPDSSLPKSVTHFCLPGHAPELVHTSPPLFAKALAFCRDYFGFDPPCTSFKLLWVGPLGEDKYVNRCAGGGLAVFSGHLLHESRNIEAGFEAREIVMSTLVQSYIGSMLRPRQAEDAWIIAGLSAHVTNLGLRSIFGHNWYRFKVHDEMQALFDEKLEDSVILSQVDNTVHIDITKQKVRRRALIIVYMIQKRIGAETMRRAIRDLVAEGRNVIVALSEQLNRCRQNDQDHHTRTNHPTQGSHNFVMRAFSSASKSLEIMDDEPDKLKDQEDGTEDANPGPSKRLGSTGAASGFDDGLLGISVTHFLKRLRAISGTDVKALVRSWAPSNGYPRFSFGHRYNTRRHSVEFVAEQHEELTVGGKQPIALVGDITVKVMEVEGAHEHTVEIRDLLLHTDLALMSRRTKKSIQIEKDPNYDPMKWTPVSFVRIDPDQEWCFDYKLKQPDHMLIAMLQSERDAIGQYLACKELASSRSPAAAKALVGVLDDDQVYWRVQAEAAQSLATCTGGLEALLGFCRDRFTDRDANGTDNVRRNKFNNFAHYLVKKAIVNALAKASENKSGLLKRRIHPEAVKFIMELLKGNDNAGNTHDDDAYVAELILAAGKIAIEYVDDFPWGRKKSFHGLEAANSQSVKAIQEIERYVALDRLIPGKSGAVTCALLRALAEFEVAKLANMERRGVGTPVQDLVRGLHKPNLTLARLIETNCQLDTQLNVRLEALRAFALVYTGDLSIAHWLIIRVDSYNNSETEIADAWYKRGSFSKADSYAAVGGSESPAVRLRVMQSLNEAVQTTAWRPQFTPPLTRALRRCTNRAKNIAIKMRKLMVADIDDRIRAMAARFVLAVWGKGAPVCFLGRIEYNEAVRMVKELKAQGNQGNLNKPVVPPEKRKMPLIWPKTKPKSNGKSAKKEAKNKLPKSSSHHKNISHLGLSSQQVIQQVQQQPLPQNTAQNTHHLPLPPPPAPKSEKEVAKVQTLHRSSLGRQPVAVPVKVPPTVKVGKVTIPNSPRISVPKIPKIVLKPPSAPKAQDNNNNNSRGLSFTPDDLDDEDLNFMQVVLEQEKKRTEIKERARVGSQHQIRGEENNDEKDSNNNKSRKNKKERRKHKKDKSEMTEEERRARKEKKRRKREKERSTKDGYDEERRRKKHRKSEGRSEGRSNEHTNNNNDNNMSGTASRMGSMLLPVPPRSSD